MTSSRFSILASVLLLASTAAAQSGTAIAEGLFREGKKLLDAKKFAEACPKFEESARLDPSSGVELALGICNEGLGKTASAWAAYETAVSLARRDNRHDRERAASARAAALEPKLSHATVEIAPDMAHLNGLQVKEDGVVLGSAAWTNAPIDPGSHTLDVSAPGKKPWSTTFTIDTTAGSSKSITVPALEDEPVQTPLGNGGGGGVVVGPPQANPFRTASYITLGTGVASVIVASVLGGIAISNANDARKSCTPPTCTDARAVSENNTAGTLADWSTVLFVASGALVATSVVLFFIHAPAAPRAASVHPLLGPGFAGLGGTF